MTTPPKATQGDVFGRLLAAIERAEVTAPPRLVRLLMAAQVVTRGKR